MDVLLVSKPVAPPWNDSSKNLVRDLASGMRRHRPIVLTTRDAVAPVEGVQVERVYAAAAGAFAPSIAQNVRVLARLLAGRKADLWHFFFAPNPRSSKASSLASRVRRVPTVQTVCSAPLEGADLRALLFADRTVVLSRRTEQRLLEAGIAAEKLVRIPPAVPELPAPDGERLRATRDALGLPGDRPLVLYPGDLEFGGGAQLALDAFDGVHRHTDAFLAIACRAKTPAARDAEAHLREEVDRRGLRTDVGFVGETSRILDLLATADVVLLPSETLYAKMDLPLVLLEAMALGRAVIVAAGTPAEELAEGGGAIATATDREAVTAALRALLDDGAARARLGAAAREVARSRYSIAEMARAYERVYDALGSR